MLFIYYLNKYELLAVEFLNIFIKMGTLYCDGGSNNGSYVSTTLTVSLDTAYDCPASWTPATNPEFWVGVVANGSDYKLKFWDDNPTGFADANNTAIATTNFTGSPLEFQIAVNNNGGITNVTPDPNGFDGPQNLVIYTNGTPSHGVKFKFVPTSSGPTVTSITATKIFVPSDTVSNTDFTLLKNASAYANTNISLDGPGPQPPSDARGYAYALNYSGTAWYTTNIDSKSFNEFYYDDSWTQNVSGLASGRNTTSNRILNVLGKIPSTTIISSTDLTLVKDTNASSERYIRWYSATGGINSNARNHNYGMYITTTTSDIKVVLYYYPEGFGSNITYSSEFSIGNQETLSYTAGGHTITVQDWIYRAQPEGDGYVPVPTTSTTSNGGGKPDRYPLIMTNLFNRNRSLYSIGMTHKDTWDLFL